MKKILFLVCLTITLLSCNKDKDLSNVKPNDSNAKVEVPTPQASVTQSDLIEYLFEYGIAIYEYPHPKPNSIADWICHTSYKGIDYWTTLHIGIIEGQWQLIGHTNNPY